MILHSGDCIIMVVSVNMRAHALADQGLAFELPHSTVSTQYLGFESP